MIQPKQDEDVSISPFDRTNHDSINLIDSQWLSIKQNLLLCPLISLLFQPWKVVVSSFKYLLVLTQVELTIHTRSKIRSSHHLNFIRIKCDDSDSCLCVIVEKSSEKKKDKHWKTLQTMKLKQGRLTDFSSHLFLFLSKHIISCAESLFNRISKLIGGALFSLLRNKVDFNLLMFYLHVYLFLYICVYAWQRIVASRLSKYGIEVSEFKIRIRRILTKMRKKIEFKCHLILSGENVR